MFKVYVVTLLLDGKLHQQAVCYTRFEALKLYHSAAIEHGPDAAHLNTTLLSIGATRLVLDEMLARVCGVVDAIRSLFGESSSRKKMQPKVPHENDSTAL